MNSSTVDKKSQEKHTLHRRWAWILYDWANSSFATTVIAGFFPLFFKGHWAPEITYQESTFLIGAVNSLISLALIVLAPILGALADRGLRRRQFLGYFVFIGAFSTAGLWLVDYGQTYLALALFGLGSLGFFAGNVFYDAMLTEVSTPKDYDRTSSLGYAFGYLGGALLFLAQVVAYLNPGWFGLDDGAQAIKIAFVSVGIWWTLFSLPLLMMKGSASPQPASSKASFSLVLKGVAATLKSLRATPVILWFLVAFLFYNDGVNTIIKMAVDLGLSIGFSPEDMITALLITNFIGFPAAIVYGYLGERKGSLWGIQLAIFAYLGITVWGGFIDAIHEFYVLAAMIGLFQGGIQALSRAHFARLVPKEHAAEYFGLFNFLGKFSAILGPILMGTVALLSGSHQASLIVLGALFLLGYWALLKHKRALEEVKAL